MFRPRAHPLDAIFTPRSIAVVGATETPGTVGRAVIENLTQGPLGDKVFPVNLKRAQVLGRRAYPTVGDVPRPVDLAVIAAPANCVPGVIEQCIAAGITGAIVISAGFKEAGDAGAQLERQIAAHVRGGRIRIIGPNCLGVMNPHIGLNATFAATGAHPGSVGFISQSGALCTAVLDWSKRENVGFSAFVSVGSMLDVGWGDLIDYLGDDPRTKSIVLYMESIGDARSFLSAAREVALSKPIVVLKVGRTEQASRAAASHTGALTGSDDVLDAAFKRAGVLRVDTVSELFSMVDVLSRQPRPGGPRLTIVTNAGGPGVLATDALVSGGGVVAPLSTETTEKLNQLLPPHWSRNNPIDVLGDADADRYIKAVEIAAKNPESDGLLVILTPQAMTDPLETARRLAPLTHSTGKPILASWMGGGGVENGSRVLNAADIPCFEFPDSAAGAFCRMWQYSRNLDSLYETPAHVPEATVNPQAATDILDIARRSGRTLLTEFESKKLLAAYGIPTVETRIATNIEAAVGAANDIGYPVAVKLHSETITHKSDVGGVKLNLANADAVRDAFKQIQESVAKLHGRDSFTGVTVQPMVDRSDAYELVIGSSTDAQFGPVLLFGSGGQLVEVLQDRALGLPPLNSTLARRMMEQTKIYTALLGVRGRKAVDLHALERLLVRFSRLVAEQLQISQIDINPLLASSRGLLALDARVILHDGANANPQPAIRPYPIHYSSRWTMKNGEQVLIRPIRPDDEPLMVEFHRSLSDEVVHQRYFATLKLEARIAHSRLRRICFNDYDREIALVVEQQNNETGRRAILGVARLSKSNDANQAEFAIVIGGPWQGLGLGSELLQRLVQIGRAEKLDRIVGQMLPDNHAMINVSRRIGFDVEYDEKNGVCAAELPQNISAWTCEQQLSPEEEEAITHARP